MSLLRWRSGGVKHPHDMPPFRFPPSPTLGDSSEAVAATTNEQVYIPEATDAAATPAPLFARKKRGPAPMRANKRVAAARAKKTASRSQRAAKQPKKAAKKAAPKKSAKRAPSKTAKKVAPKKTAKGKKSKR
ncbi:hypothetical protein ABIB75_006517 [Bradyrhizobium sp. GM2.2]